MTNTIKNARASLKVHKIRWEQFWDGDGIVKAGDWVFHTRVGSHLGNLYVGVYADDKLIHMKRAVLVNEGIRKMLLKTPAFSLRGFRENPGVRGLNVTFAEMHEGLVIE